MIIRMFEYGFRKGKENADYGGDNIKRLYFPKQKVIFFEENKNIEDSLKLMIVFGDEKEVNIMTKSLYDLEVEKKGIKKGIEKGIEKNQVEIVLNMLGEGLDEATISRFTKIDIERVREIIKKHLN